MVENHPDTDSAGESGMRELRYETDPIDKTETPVDGYVSALTNDAWSLTLEGDAERVLGMFADRIMVLKYRYRHARIKFDVLSLRKDGRWERSAVAVQGMISEASRHWSMRAADELPAREAKAAIKYLTRNAESPHARKVMARIPVISQRWRETGVADYRRLTYASIDDLDANGRYLGCANGILDLMTGRLLPLEEAKRALVTRYVGIDYRPEASHWAVDLLLAHLAQELKDYLLAMVGRAIWAQPDKIFLVIMGPTQGGKSTFLLAVATALGHEVGTLSSDALRPTRGSRVGPTPEKAPLLDCRIVMATECSSWRFDPEKLKSYSGGDFIPHQPKFQSEKTGAVRATMILAGNAVPELGLHDPAVVSRTRVIPYPSLPSEIPDIKQCFSERDREASEAMLALLVRYAVAHPPGADIRIPKVVREAIDDAIDDECGRIGRWVGKAVKADS